MLVDVMSLHHVPLDWSPGNNMDCLCLLAQSDFKICTPWLGNKIGTYFNQLELASIVSWLDYIFISSVKASTFSYFQAFFSLFSLSLVTSSPVPDAAPEGYASDYTQYFLAPEPAPQANQFHSQDDAGIFCQVRFFVNPSPTAM